MQLASTSMPRSARSSATCSYAKGYRRYQRTACRITSPGYWRPLNGFVAEIGTDSYPINLDASNFATKPSIEMLTGLLITDEPWIEWLLVQVVSLRRTVYSSQCTQMNCAQKSLDNVVVVRDAPLMACCYEFALHSGPV